MTPLQIALRERYKIEPAVFPFALSGSVPPSYVIRVSAQLYNTRADYERLSVALQELLA